MTEGTRSIRRARRDDIAFIMPIERLPGYPEKVGAWSCNEHQEKMQTPGYAYFVYLESETLVGFAIFKDIGNEMGNLCLHRIAVGAVGKGHGTFFIRHLCRLAFDDASVYRLWLDVLPSNTLARHVYRKVGFVEEGVMRSALQYPDGRRADLLLMSLLRPDWPGL